jgi:hypothetical protein
MRGLLVMNLYFEMLHDEDIGVGDVLIVVVYTGSIDCGHLTADTSRPINSTAQYRHIIPCILSFVPGNGRINLAIRVSSVTCQSTLTCFLAQLTIPGHCTPPHNSQV